MAGVQIRVHASFLLLFLIVALAGAATTLQGALAELAWISFIFACVLVHELAHSVTAIRLGVRVRDIVLLPLGGVSEMERLPDDPRREMTIAAAGPAASVALAVVALVGSAALGQHWWPPALWGGSVLARVGWINAVLAGFNLLPVLPMDGGRLLRAGLESRLGRTRSTLVAARIGQVGGALFIAVGLFYDVWLTFIGVFILLGAAMESADAELHRRLSVVRVDTAMMASPLTAESDLRIDRQYLDHVLGRQVILPVTAGGRYIGAIGPEQLPSPAEVAMAGGLADRGAPTVHPDEPLDHALDVLQEGVWPAVVVVGSDGRVEGIVTAEGMGRAISRYAGASR